MDPNAKDLANALLSVWWRTAVAQCVAPHTGTGTQSATGRAWAPSRREATGCCNKAASTERTLSIHRRTGAPRHEGSKAVAPGPCSGDGDVLRLRRKLAR